MSKLTPTFLLFGVAIVFWSVSLGLSEYLAKDFAREHGQGAGAQAGPVDFNISLEAAKKAASADPKNVDAQLALGYSYLREAYQSSDGKLLMEAVKSFHATLELSPEHPQALLGLATLCLESGILDKALEYYPRYLEQEPEDLRARSDLALALGRAEKFDDAHRELDTVLSKEEHFFPALMTRAFIFRAEKKLDKALEQAELARAHAPSVEVKENVGKFIAELSGNGSSMAEPADVPNTDEFVSPARLVNDYFRSHQIVGPKVRAISWPKADLVEISLDNFPVSQMPPFAREKFIAGIKEHLKALSEPITLVLKDASTAESLLEITAGASPKGLEASKP